MLRRSEHLARRYPRFKGRGADSFASPHAPLQRRNAPPARVAYPKPTPRAHGAQSAATAPRPLNDGAPLPHAPRTRPTRRANGGLAMLASTIMEGRTRRFLSARAALRRGEARETAAWRSTGRRISAAWRANEHALDWNGAPSFKKQAALSAGLRFARAALPGLRRALKDARISPSERRRYDRHEKKVGQTT